MSVLLVPCEGRVSTVGELLVACEGRTEAGYLEVPCQGRVSLRGVEIDVSCEGRVWAWTPAYSGFYLDPDLG